MSDQDFHEPGAENKLGADRAALWDQLRSAREAQGWSKADVAHTLKLTPKQVEAMESGDLQKLPGVAFARGFLRNYARLLGLDANPYLDACDPVRRDGALQAPPPQLASMPSNRRLLSRFPALPSFTIALALFTLVVCGWYFEWFEPREEASLADVLLAAPKVASAPPPAAASAPAAQPPVGSEPVASVASATAAPSAPVAASEPLASAPLAVAGQGITIQFLEESWVEVRDATGTVLFIGTDGAGSQRVMQGAAPFSLVIGNAPGVKVSYKGRPVELGSYTSGRVARLSLP